MTKITVYTEVKSSLDTVWKSWNESEHMTKWFSWSSDWHTPRATNDVKVWGKFVIRMEAKDESQWFDFEWQYTRIEENNFIKYIMDDGREVENIFEEIWDTVRITTIFDAENIHSITEQREGWQHIANNFKNYTEQL